MTSLVIESPVEQVGDIGIAFAGVFRTQNSANQAVAVALSSEDEAPATVFVLPVFTPIMPG